MPIAVRNSPFEDDDEVSGGGGKVDNKRPPLRVPQVRVLMPLIPQDPTWPDSEWPLLTRANLGVNAGYTAISGSVTRALNGIYEGSSSGDAHPGLLTMGYVEEVVLDVDGVKEVNYRATRLGALAYMEWVVANGGKLPELKDKMIYINDRYKRGG